MQYSISHLNTLHIKGISLKSIDRYEDKPNGHFPQATIQYMRLKKNFYICSLVFLQLQLLTEWLFLAVAIVITVAKIESIKHMEINRICNEQDYKYK